MGPAKLLVLEYHTGDSYSTAQIDKYMQGYGVNGTPTVVFNYLTRPLGGDPSQYRDVVNQLLAAPSPISLNVAVTFTDEMHIDVSATNLGGSALTGAVVTSVIYQDIGTSGHHYVVLDIVSSVLPAALQPSVPQQVHLTSPISGATSGLGVVVFLQAQGGGIMQSALAAFH